MASKTSGLRVFGAMVAAFTAVGATALYFTQRSENHGLKGTEWAVYAKAYRAKRPSAGNRKLRFGDDGKLTFRDMYAVMEGKYHLGAKYEVRLEIPDSSGGTKPEVNTTDSEVRNLNATSEVFVRDNKLKILFADGAICECVPLSKRIPTPPGLENGRIDEIAKGNLTAPTKLSQLVSYAFASSSGKEFVLNGDTICFDATGFEIYYAKRQVFVTVREWETSWQFDFDVGSDQTIGPGRYAAPLSEDIRNRLPRVVISGASRTDRETVGEFVIWEFHVDPKNEVTALAVDFFLRGSSGKGPPMFGSVRFNSSFE